MYDLIIVGGGPSGSSAGRIAGIKGLKTLLLEKEDFPRYKPCGGALSEHAISYLDFELPESMIEKEIFGGRIRFHDNSIDHYKDQRLSVIVTRSIFDSYLLEKARETGIDFRLNEKVTDITQKKAYVCVKSRNTVYRSRFVIIATGSQGSLKHLVRRPDGKEEYGVCLVTEIEENDEKIDQYLKNIIEMQFGVSGAGYGWIFPHRGYYSVGAGSVMADHLDNPKKAVKDYLRFNGFTGEHKLNGHVIPCGGYKREILRGRILLSGDAAGFVDAFTGEGLAYAIRSGQLASDVIAELIGKRSDLSELEDYKKRCNSEFGEHLRYSLFFSKIMHYFPERSFNAFINDTEILDSFFDVVAFKKTYKDLIKWIVYNFKLAWLKKNDYNE